MIERDVLVVGGGPLGLALALALRGVGVDCAVADARPPGAAEGDPRVLALSHGSRQMLERLSVWRALAPTPIETIHVSHRGHFGRTLLRAADYRLPALGYVQAAGALARALGEAVRAAGVPVYYGTDIGAASSDAANLVVGSVDEPKAFSVRLLAQAEGAAGRDGFVIRQEYDQEALICNVALAQPHGGLAYERFTSEGPVALLPHGSEYALVFSASPGRVQALLAMSDEDFLGEVGRQFGGRVRFVDCGARHRFPLALVYRLNPVGERRVALGNAAQTLHPVAGQGFNLALRDAWTLREVLSGASDPGDPALLARYASLRRLDRVATIRFTDALVRVFSTDFAPVATLRGAGLLGLDLLPPLRDFLARRMIFGARSW